MKLKIVALLAIFLITNKVINAQIMNNYETDWKKIEDLISKGLSKSAQDATRIVFNKATKEKNTPQIIKAAMLLVGYRSVLIEQSELTNHFFLDTLIAQSNGAAKAILQSMQAQHLYNYLQSNRWRFYGRTNIVKENDKDIETWSIEKLHRTIGQLYRASLKDAAMLQALPSSAFDAIVIKGENTAELRTTMYDLLAHRALAYFSSREAELTKPADYFALKDEKLFAPAEEFAKWKINTTDTVSNDYNTIKLYQQLLAFRIANKNTDALIDADLLRLKFVHQHAKVKNGQRLYMDALENIAKKYSNNQYGALASVEIAEMLKTSTASKTHKEDNKRAFEICNNIIKKFPKSAAAARAKNVLRDLLEKTLDIQHEKVWIPKEPALVKINFQNITKVHLRLVKVTTDQLDKIDDIYDEIKQLKAYLALKPTKTWTVDLPKADDYIAHSTEIKVDALPLGYYVLLASEKENFDGKNNIVVVSEILVSNMMLVENQNEFHVLDRNTGEPVANVGVKVDVEYYDYNTRKNLRRNVLNTKTNNNGYFNINIADLGQENSYKLVLQNGDDTYNTRNVHYIYNDYRPTKTSTNTEYYLFTDRSIYRPGQSVYFKGIVTERDSTGIYRVLNNHSTKVILRNRNSEVVGDVKVKTNEYGSFNGVFTLPQSGLTGNFSISIEDQYAYKSILVEEYKRPKFKVEIEKPTTSYKVGDDIKIVGQAKAFAGNNIDGAKVKYRVERRTDYLWWWFGYRYGMGGTLGSNPIQLADGETTTDADGKFIINFNALADEDANMDAKPVTNYTIYADVTDRNGETHSANYSLALNQHALNVNIIKTPTAEKQELLIGTTNSAGVHQDVKVKVTISAQKAPTTYLRNRLWETPDLPLMDSATFKSHFPLDVYRNEDKQMNWAKSAVLWEQTIDNKDAKAITITPPLPAGYYVIEVAATDKNGAEVKDIKYIQIRGKTNAFDNAISLNDIKPTYEPNDALQYAIQSSFQKAFVIHERQFMNSRKDYIDNTKSFHSKGLHRTYELMRNGILQHAIKLTEADRGGVSIHAFFVKHNRFFAVNQIATIPWSNKELNISFETFRDKTLPGSDEEYKVKITGEKSSLVAAELLATMYDASLDEFISNQFQIPGYYPVIHPKTQWSAGSSLQSVQADGLVEYDYDRSYFSKTYDELGVKLGSKKKKRVEPLWWLNPLDYNTDTVLYRSENVVYDAPFLQKSDGRAIQAAPAMAMESMAEKKKSVYKPDQAAASGVSDSIESGAPSPTNKQTQNQPRKNFNETAFFIPDAVTDAQGNIILKYKIPEALTEWKLLALAHTKDLKRGLAEKKVITQKPMMVQPNLPRFIREGDKIELPVKIVNLTDKEITGSAELALINPETNTSVDGWFKNMYANQYFTVAAGQSTVVMFPIEIPFGYNKPLTIRTSAASSKGATASVSDAEENIVPVLTNRMLVTETMPLPMKPNSSKNFQFKKLINNNSNTLSHHGLTVEFTNNPVWYAVQALPYLMEYPYECAEQTFNRYYANTLATHIANKTPRLKEVFEKWKGDGKALQSALQKNEELKNIVLAETPWVMEAQSEAAQKQKIALLFDLQKMAAEQAATLSKLKELQTSNGGFMWFKGGRDDRFVTQYILIGIGHLIKLNVLNLESPQISSMVQAAIQYTDQRVREDYEKIKDKSKPFSCSHYQLHYLYMRSFFPQIAMAENVKPAYNFFLSKLDYDWQKQPKYQQGLIALVAHRNKLNETAQKVVKSLKENSIVNEELGMYWKEVRSGYYWHEAPTETMALMVEVFSEVTNDEDAILGLKTWLLKNKQTTNWKTTIATADACYALLLQGDKWTADDAKVELKLNNIVIEPTNAEAGTGYTKHRIQGDKVKENMGNIQVAVSGSKSPSWGAAYWQYFEDIDKITGAETPLKLKKKVYKQITTKTGIKLEEVVENAQLKVGDKLTIRIELRVDRDMEYVHMKDMRSAGTEPLNVLSQYKWQDGLGYYEATKDASTNFFFSYLYKGTYVFEYPLYVTHKGNFSNGITTIQCMYAPEFTSHSNGVRVNVE